MDNLRCQCGKIICQLHENMVILKCRHCKRFIIIKINPEAMLQQKNQNDFHKYTKIEFK